MASRPDLSEYQVSPNPNGLQAPTAPNVQEQGSQQLSALGEATQHAGAAGAAIFTDKLQEANRVRVDDALNQLKERQLDYTYGPNGFTNQHGHEALFNADGSSRNLAEEYGTNLATDADNIAATLGNERQRQAFQQGRNSIALGFRDDIERHYNTAFNTYAQSVREGAITNWQQQLALANGDPTKINEAVLGIRANVAELARQTDHSADWAEARTLEMLSTGHKQAVQGFLNSHDITAAQAYMGVHQGEMTAEDRLAVNAAIGQEGDLVVATQVADEYGPNAHSSTQAPARTSFNSRTEAIGALGHELQGQGYHVGENDQFGGMHAHHTDPNHHANDIDVSIANARGTNYASNPQYKARFDQLALTLQARGYRILWNHNIYDPGHVGPTHPIPAHNSRGQAISMHEDHLHAEAPTSITSASPARQPAAATISDAMDRLHHDPRLAANPRALAEAERQVRQSWGDHEHDVQQGQEHALDNVYGRLNANGGHWEQLTAAERSSVPGHMIPQLQSYANEVQTRARGVQPDGVQSTALWGQIREGIAGGTITRPEQLQQFLPYLRQDQRDDLVRNVTDIAHGNRSAIDSARTTTQVLEFANDQLHAAGLDTTQAGGAHSSQYAQFRGVLLQRIQEAERVKGSSLTVDEGQRIALGLMAQSATGQGGMTGWFRRNRYNYELDPSVPVAPGMIPPGVREQIIASLRRRGKLVNGDTIRREYMLATQVLGQH